LPSLLDFAALRSKRLPSITKSTYSSITTPPPAPLDVLLMKVVFVIHSVATSVVRAKYAPPPPSQVPVVVFDRNCVPLMVKVRGMATLSAPPSDAARFSRNTPPTIEPPVIDTAPPPLDELPATLLMTSVFTRSAAPTV